MTIEGPVATIIGSVLGALIVGGVALLVWGISALFKISERLGRVGEGQANLAEDLTELKSGQVKLESSQAKLSEDMTQLAVGQVKLEANQTKLSEDVARLSVNQTKLTEDVAQLTANQAKLTEEQAKQAADIAQLKPGQDEILRRLDALST